jgi:AraC-like DNA-binding protein
MNTPEKCATAAPALIYVSSRRYLYLGQTQLRIRELHAAASSLLVCLQGCVRFRCTGDATWSRTRSLLIRAGSRVAIDNQGAVMAACYLDAGQADFPRLKRQMGAAMAGLYYNHGHEQRLIDSLIALRDERPAFAEAQERLERILHPQAPGHPVTIDPRLTYIIERLRDTATLNLPVSALAQEIGLSESGLIKLFRLQVGAPLRRHRLWYRLIEFIELALSGTSTATAIKAAGFTDGAHLSRCYSSFFGVNYAYAFSPSTAVHYILEPRLQPDGAAPR